MIPQSTVQLTSKPCTDPLWQDVLSSPNAYTPAQIKAMYEENKAIKRSKQQSSQNGNFPKERGVDQKFKARGLSTALSKNFVRENS